MSSLVSTYSTTAVYYSIIVIGIASVKTALPPCRGMGNPYTDDFTAKKRDVVGG